MLKSRVVAGLVGAGAIAALLASSATVAAGAQSAERAVAKITTPATTDQGSLELVGGRSVVDLGERWYIHSVPLEFSVTAGSAIGEEEDGGTLFVSWPPEMVLDTFTGKGWECAAVDGGVECINWAVVGPGQLWPTLTMSATGTKTVTDTLDVYLQGVGNAETHVGVPFTYDTST